uniref:Uncharacterized protein n=1 Tax=Plectus sambesii TaxID=2011161 RepID=A0A914WEW5_9BILA
MSIQLKIQEQGRVKVVQARAELDFFRHLKKSKHMQNSIVRGQLQPPLYPKSAFFASTSVKIKQVINRIVRDMGLRLRSNLQLLEVAVPLQDIDHHFHRGSWKCRYLVEFPTPVGLAWQSSTRGGPTGQRHTDRAMVVLKQHHGKFSLVTFYPV